MGCTESNHNGVRGSFIKCYDNGFVYVGQMSNNSPNGFGAMHYEDGSIIYGHWLNGEIDQTMQVQSFKDGIALVGLKSKGRFIGQVKAFFQDGEEYVIKRSDDEEEIYKKIKTITQNKEIQDFTTPQPTINQNNSKLQQNFPPQICGTSRKYKLIKKVGSGGFGQIFKYESPSQFKGLSKPFAVKYDPKESSQANEFEIVKKLKQFPHKNLVAFEQIKTQQNKKYLIMEYCQGSLSQFLHFPKDKLFVLFHMYQLCRGLQHMHQKACYHRDIKPANILVTFFKQNVSWLTTFKFCDFGISQSIDCLLITDLAVYGTPNYNPPERIAAKPNQLKRIDYSKCDVWSLGLVFIEMMGRRILAGNTDYIRVYSKDSRKNLEEFISSQIRPEYQTTQIMELLIKMLKFDPKERASIKQARQLLMKVPQFISQNEMPINMKKTKTLEERLLQDKILLRANVFFWDALANCQQLRLDNCRLSRLPERLFSLKHLITLRLDNNQLTNLPETLGCLRILKTLYLHKNKLQGLPQSFQALNELAQLSLDLSLFPENDMFERKTIQRLNKFYLFSAKFEKERFRLLEKQSDLRGVSLYLIIL